VVSVDRGRQPQGDRNQTLGEYKRRDTSQGGDGNRNYSIRLHYLNENIPESVLFRLSSALHLVLSTGGPGNESYEAVKIMPLSKCL
jgi:hypothetical protein